MAISDKFLEQLAAIGRHTAMAPYGAAAAPAMAPMPALQPSPIPPAPAPAIAPPAAMPAVAPMPDPVSAQPLPATPAAARGSSDPLAGMQLAGQLPAAGQAIGRMFDAYSDERVKHRVQSGSKAVQALLRALGG